MSKTPQDPGVRWRDRPLGNRAPEDRAAEIIRRSLPARAPEDVALERIERSLLDHPAPKRRSPLVFRLALTLLFLSLGVASVKAYTYARRAGWIGTGAAAVAPVDPAKTEAPHKSAKRGSEAKPALTPTTLAPAPVAEETAPAPAAAPATPPAVTPLPHARPQKIAMVESPARPTTNPRASAPAEVRPTAEAASGAKPGQLALGRPSEQTVPAHGRGDSHLEPPPAFAPTTAFDRGKPSPATKAQASPPPISPAAEEARALDHALTLLRREHNGGAALVALDGYLGRYPSGLLNHEARIARVDALLMLGRSDDALVALEGLSFDGRRRSNELQVIRAELRSRVSCTSAVADFTAALVNSRDAHLIERIFYGRGTCRAKLGDKNGAAQDLRLYLQRFPLGVHATWAREWLAGFDGNSKSGR
jgi:hypothetical protein